MIKSVDCRGRSRRVGGLWPLRRVRFQTGSFAFSVGADPTVAWSHDTDLCRVCRCGNPW